MKKYIPSQVEPKWQQKWASEGLYKTDLSSSKNKYYVLVELPYTSGDLHMGHWFTFGMGDILARFRRSQGFNVLFPNGFDTFGLPAENAAIRNNMHPRDWTYANIKRMKEQYGMMGVSVDWDKTAVTCEPEYYKWNQWIFLKMFEKDIAYRGKTLSNWCPTCKTVLADENVEAGKCWRCSTEVMRKEIDQWFLRLTQYANELLWQDPPQVDWPKSLREAQNNWIGKSEGIVIKFDKLEIYTTRQDTIFGTTFIVISPEHPLLVDIVAPENKKQVEKYLALIKNEQALSSGNNSELERKRSNRKTGVFTGFYVTNPLTNQQIPVWVADYVLMYGTGAVMGVPASDARDFEFAKKYGLEIKNVVEPVMGQLKENEEFRKSIVAIVYDPKTKKYLSVNWGKELGGSLFVGGRIDGNEEPVQTAAREVTEETGYKNIKLISTTEKIHYHYYAYSKKKNRKIEAIGMYFELVDNDRTEPKLEEDEKNNFEVEWLTNEEVESKIKEELHKYVFDHLLKGAIFEGEGILVDSGDYSGMSTSEAREKISDYIEKHNLGQRKTNYHLHDWSISRQRYWGTPIPIIYCDSCGIVPVPEKDLPVELPYEVDYTPQGKPPLATVEEWVNIKCPKCGGKAQREVETMDGFVDNSWYFYRYLDNHNDKEIFNKEIIQNWMPVNVYIGGAEHTVGHTLYSRFFTKFFHDLGLVSFDEYALKRINHGVILGPDGHRMSKSKGNVVNPDIEVKKYGADAIRLYLAFLGPYDLVAPWNPDGVNGVYHFLQRVWNLFDKVDSESLSATDAQMLHKTIKKVSEDIAELKLNTAIASLMEWLNYLSRKEKISKEEYKTFLLLLAPFAPHITEELWSVSGKQYSIHNQSWPKFDNKYLENEEVILVVQINGRVRDKLVIVKDILSNEKVVEKMALESKKVQKFLNGGAVKRSVYIPGKVLNLVV